MNLFFWKIDIFAYICYLIPYTFRTWLWLNYCLAFSWILYLLYFLYFIYYRGKGAQSPNATVVLSSFCYMHAAYIQHLYTEARMT